MTRKPIVSAYINPQQEGQLTALGDICHPDGTRAVTHVCIFAANYVTATRPYLHSNNDPKSPKEFNENILNALREAKVLQDLGVKVLLTVINGWQPVGWSEFTSEPAAADFAAYLLEKVAEFSLDGIDLDDEYSTGTPVNDSLAMVTTKLAHALGGKLLSKALFADQPFFNSNWQGHTLAGNLDFGWEMSYGGGDVDGRLKPYVDAGMRPDQLALGYWAQHPTPEPKLEIATLREKGYGGFMVFATENPQNVALLKTLVQYWDAGASAECAGA